MCTRWSTPKAERRGSDCYSEARAKKAQGIANRFAARFEGELGSTTACPGRAPASGSTGSGSASAGSGRRAAALRPTTTSTSSSVKAAQTRTRQLEAPPARRAGHDHPWIGVYCLRTDAEDWDEEALWRTYTSLTDVEAVFRSLKSKLGLRPIFHHDPDGASDRCTWFITVIAPYQMVQTIRRRLGEQGARARRWTSLRRILEGRHRVTATASSARTEHPSCPQGKTRAEPRQQEISISALALDPCPRRHQENDRLTPDPSKETGCSALREIYAP